MLSLGFSYKVTFFTALVLSPNRPQDKSVLFKNNFLISRSKHM